MHTRVITENLATTIPGARCRTSAWALELLEDEKLDDTGAEESGEVDSSADESGAEFRSIAVPEESGQKHK